MQWVHWSSKSLNVASNYSSAYKWEFLALNKGATGMMIRTECALWIPFASHYINSIRFPFQQNTPENFQRHRLNHLFTKGITMFSNGIKHQASRTFRFIKKLFSEFKRIKCFEKGWAGWEFKICLREGLWPFLQTPSLLHRSPDSLWHQLSIERTTSWDSDNRWVKRLRAGEK